MVPCGSQIGLADSEPRGELLMNQDTVSGWENWLQAHPADANYIWHDPTAQVGEFRVHNGVLHLVVLGHWDHVAEPALLVNLLLKHHANPNVQNDEGNTPLHFACQHPTRDVGVVELLLKHGATPNILNLLLSHGADLDLNSAIRLGRVADVARILERGGLAQARFPETALLDAVGTRLPDLVKLILDYSKKGGDQLPSDVLCRAIEVNQPAIVRMLLAHGADPHAECDGADALAYAKQLERDAEIIQLLEQAHT
jgi:hypothetical protein